MMQAVRKLYRFIVPQNLRRDLALREWTVRKQKLREAILAHCQSVDDTLLNDEQRAALDFLRTNTLDVFPHRFALKYRPDDIEVHFDKDRLLYFVWFGEYKLFYKRGWSKARIKGYHNGLSQEQDIESAHRYLFDAFDVKENDVVVDVGAAEGIFALSVIDRVKSIYLFEPDPAWQEALRATFEPFGNKAVIVKKSVSDRNDEKHVTLDSYFQHHKPDFIKIDVDGGEREALRGAKQTINEKQNLKIALCAYHHQADETEFTALLQQHDFKVEVANGYMIFYYDKSLAPPYFRRGVLRATKFA